MPLGDALAAAAPLAPTQGAAAPTEEASQPGEQNASPTPSPEGVPLCAICKEALLGTHVTALPCAHSFHTGCIQHWADVKGVSLQDACPLHTPIPPMVICEEANPDTPVVTPQGTSIPLEEEGFQAAMDAMQQANSQLF